MNMLTVVSVAGSSSNCRFIIKLLPPPEARRGLWVGAPVLRLAVLAVVQLLQCIDDQGTFVEVDLQAATAGWAEHLSTAAVVRSLHTLNKQ